MLRAQLRTGSLRGRYTERQREAGKQSVYAEKCRKKWKQRR